VPYLNKYGTLEIFYSRFRDPHEYIYSTYKPSFQKINGSSRHGTLTKKIMHRIHNCQAAEFFKIFNNHEESKDKACFDFLQNQPFLKLSVGKIFYSRQVWLFTKIS
jgi:hypothetical protein